MVYPYDSLYRLDRLNRLNGLNGSNRILPITRDLRYNRKSAKVYFNTVEKVAFSIRRFYVAKT